MAIQAAIESLEIYEQLGDSTEIIEANDVLAGIFMSIGRLDEAEKIYTKMLDMAKRLNDESNVAMNLEYLGVNAYFKKNYSQAITLYEKALEINSKLGFDQKVGINYGNLGESYDRLGQYEKALECYNKAQSILNRHQFLSGLIYVYYSKGDTFTHIDQFDSGRYYYDKSLNLMWESGEIREVGDVNKKIAENLIEQGFHEEAIDHLRVYIQHKDSLFTIEKNQQIEELKARYDFENTMEEKNLLEVQNEQKQQQLKKTQVTIRLQYVLVSLLLLLLLVVLYLFFSLRKQGRALRRSNLTKDKLFGIVGHDLKGPVGNISALTSLMKQDVNYGNFSEDQKKMISMVEESASATSLLLDDLLSWYISQKHDITSSPEVLNLTEIAENTIQLYKLQIQSKNLEVVCEADHDFRGYADPKEVSTIFRNIISNAIKYTAAGGSIRILAKREVKRQKSYIKISIIDTGIGMPQRKINLLFSGKNITSSTGTDDEIGSGLGLALVKELIQNAEGYMEIKSEENVGTTVSFGIPEAIQQN